MISKPERIAPGPGQESVWDYPRPPRLEQEPEGLRVVFAGETIADSNRAYRVLETSHPPVFYIPWSDIRDEFLIAAPGQSYCEFKGVARYWNVKVGDATTERAAWSYPNPTAGFAPLKDHLAFYASRVDGCWVGKERVQAQDGDFYGGWITSRVVGPFKGAAGTRGW